MRVGLQAAGAGAGGGGGGGGGGWEGWEGWDLHTAKKGEKQEFKFYQRSYFCPNEFLVSRPYHYHITTVNGVEQLRFFYGRPIGLWGWGRGGQFAFEKKIKIFTQENNSRKK